MRYVGLALYAEGPTDYQFLSPLLQRVCAEICATQATETVDFSDVTALCHPEEANDRSREERIVAAAKLHRDAWQILFIHGDGGGDPNTARGNLVQPGLEAIALEFGVGVAGVAVVPVRETEAWVLQDGDTLRSVLGTTLTDMQLGLPRTARAIEATVDPKEQLNLAFLETKPTGRRRKRGTSPMLNALGEQISIERLRRLDSFETLENEVRRALQLLRIV